MFPKSLLALTSLMVLSFQVSATNSAQSLGLSVYRCSAMVATSDNSTRKEIGLDSYVTAANKARAVEATLNQTDKLEFVTEYLPGKAESYYVVRSDRRKVIELQCGKGANLDSVIPSIIF